MYTNLFVTQKKTEICPVETLVSDLEEDWKSALKNTIRYFNIIKKKLLKIEKRKI